MAGDSLMIREGRLKDLMNHTSMLVVNMFVSCNVITLSHPIVVDHAFVRV